MQKRVEEKIHANNHNSEASPETWKSSVYQPASNDIYGNNPDNNGAIFYHHCVNHGRFFFESALHHRPAPTQPTRAALTDIHI